MSEKEYLCHFDKNSLEKDYTSTSILQSEMELISIQVVATNKVTWSLCKVYNTVVA